MTNQIIQKAIDTFLETPQEEKIFKVRKKSGSYVLVGRKDKSTWNTLSGVKNALTTHLYLRSLSIRADGMYMSKDAARNMRDELLASGEIEIVELEMKMKINKR